MKQSIDILIKKHGKAQTVKSTWDTAYKEIFEYAMPSRDIYQKTYSGSNNNPDYQDRRSNQYSSTAENSANEFVNTMQDLLCPPQANWIDIEAGPLFKDEDKEGANEELAKICTVANEYKNLSTFDMTFSEFCYDLFAGTACMLVLKGEDMYSPICFKAIPITEYCIEEGADGHVCAVYRKYTMRKELVKEQWPELKNLKMTKEDQDKDMDILETCYYDKALKVYHYVVIDMQNKSELLSREYKTSPFIVLRWNKAAGEPYGRGPGMAALNDIKTLNLIKEYGLRALAYNLPPLLVQEDAMLDVDQLDMTPFALNVVPNTQTSIVPLQLGATNPNIEQYKVQELQTDIKRMTFGNTLPNEGSRQLTATEVNQRTMELKKQLNSVFGRLISEFQIPLVRRIIDVLISQKIISDQFEVAKVNGLTYKVNVNSPISRQLKYLEAQGMLAASSLLIQLDPTGGALYSTLKVQDMSSHLMKLMGVPNQFVNTGEEIKAKQEEQAQAQQQAQLAQVKTDVEAENAMAMGKAQANVAEKDAGI